MKKSGPMLAPGPACVKGGFLKGFMFHDQALKSLPMLNQYTIWPCVARTTIALRKLS